MGYAEDRVRGVSGQGVWVLDREVRRRDDRRLPDAGKLPALRFDAGIITSFSPFFCQ